jgi:ATP-dependent Clp protease ATP-binding subunit ClpA
LRDVRVLSLDHVALLGGTTYRGQYESRITSLVEAVTGVTDVILFVDELHNLIGQGSSMGAAMDASNMLKPALVRGDFRVIGATTDDEYVRWVCGDPALERRFQRVDVRELSAADTLDILLARVPRFERHHGVVIADDALDAAVRLTDEYVTDRARPDRAIDALDEACAHAQALAVYTPVTAALLAERQALVREQVRDVVDARVELDAESDADVPDPLERFARTGFDALERFGAELEAAIVGRFGDSGHTRGDAGGRSATPESAPDSESPAAPASDAGASAESDATEPGQARRPDRRPRARGLAELDVLVRHRLATEGIVVRGHDVARAVAVATGQSVVWQAP